MKTEDASYSSHLQTRSSTWWKRLLPVQLPYQRLIRNVFPQGRILDIGCGFGRLLDALPPGSVGVDHNPQLVHAAQARGLDAVDASSFEERFGSFPPHFDGVLCAHVVEHLPHATAIQVLSGYLHSVRQGGTVVLITPQERGYRADPTHVHYYDLAGLEALASSLGLTVRRRMSYPFPAFAGPIFTYNENVVVAEVTR